MLFVIFANIAIINANELGRPAIIYYKDHPAKEIQAKHIAEGYNQVDILGGVKRPGCYFALPHITLEELIIESGIIRRSECDGFTRLTHTIVINKETRERKIFDLQYIESQAAHSFNFVLQQKDTLIFIETAIPGNPTIPIKKLLTEEEFKESGLDKLDKYELHALGVHLRKHGLTSSKR